MATAKPPADLGPRSELLIDKHVEYILSFTKIWEVRGERGEGKTNLGIFFPPKSMFL